MIEVVVLIGSSAPNAQHVHIAGSGSVDYLIIHVVGNTGQEIVVGDVVDALHKHFLSIQHEIAGAPGTVFLSHKAQRAHADLLCLLP